jgi:hypothetical protein
MASLDQPRSLTVSGEVFMEGQPPRPLTTYSNWRLIQFSGGSFHSTGPLPPSISCLSKSLMVFARLETTIKNKKKQ